MTTPTVVEDRRRWMGLLARADEASLERWVERTGLPEFTWLRRPESGLVMIRARAGGTGERFNLGEMTVTRCAVRLEGGSTGVAYVAGRSHRHAELAAIADALMQMVPGRERVESQLLAPLADRERERAQAQRRKAAATRVEFFTLARTQT
jgi:alpha-D-ribose 1-methylphosphonate 5-triphosphate synthase subunit PhnG